jgi:hypothetical protein
MSNNSERHQFISLAGLPGRLNAEEAAWVLGFTTGGQFAARVVKTILGPSSIPKFNNAHERRNYEAGQAIVARKLGKDAAPTKRTLEIGHIENEIEGRIGHRLGAISGAGTEASIREDNDQFKKLLENPFFAKTYFAAQRKTFHGKKWKAARQC